MLSVGMHHSGLCLGKTELLFITNTHAYKYLLAQCIRNNKKRLHQSIISVVM